MATHLLDMHPSELEELARVEGRVIWSAAADQMEEAGSAWEDIVGYRLLASLGCPSQTSRAHGVEVWQGVTVYPQRRGEILVRVWDRKPYKSSRMEYHYSGGLVSRWNGWRILFPKESGFTWVPVPVLPEIVRLAVETATTFKR